MSNLYNPILVHFGLTLYRPQHHFVFGLLNRAYLLHCPNEHPVGMRVSMGGLFSTNVYAEHKAFGYHKTVFGTRNPAFWVGAVSGWHSVLGFVILLTFYSCFFQ
jgi:hypothetical protein